MASTRTVSFMVCIVAVAALASGTDDSISLLRRKDTGFRLLPGSATPVAAANLKFVAPSEGIGHSNYWLRPAYLQLPEGSTPYGWSTGSWYNYFNETTRQGVVNPGQKRNGNFTFGPQ